VRRTWALRGKTPTIQSSGSWKSLTMASFVICTTLGNNPRAFFHLQPGSMDKYDFVSLLKDVKKELGPKKLLLIWDGLPAHKAKIVKDYIASNSNWLRVERYPGYAPELNPVEFIWAPMKNKDLTQIPPKGLRHLKTIVRRSFRRIKADPLLLKNCLRKAGVLS
jgi:transposase